MLASPRRIADPDRRHGYALAVALVLLISTALRLWQLSTPAEMMFDEIYYAKDAKAIVDGRVGVDGQYRWAAGDEVSWPHPEMGKFAIADGHPPVRRPLVRLAPARGDRRHRPARLRLPTGTTPRPLPSLGPAGPAVRGRRPARDRAVAHRDARHLPRRVDGPLHPAGAALRAGRLAHALALRLRRRRRHGRRDQVVRRSRHRRGGAHHPRRLARCSAAPRAGRAADAGDDGAPAPIRAGQAVGPPLVPPRAGGRGGRGARGLGRTAHRRHRRGARRGPRRRLPAQLHAVLPHRPHAGRLPRAAPADDHLQPATSRRRTPTPRWRPRGSSTTARSGTTSRAPRRTTASSPSGTRSCGGWRRCRWSRPWCWRCCGGPTRCCPPRPSSLVLYLPWFADHADLVPLLHDAGGAVHGHPRGRRRSACSPAACCRAAAGCAAAVAALADRRCSGGRSASPRAGCSGRSRGAPATRWAGSASPSASLLALARAWCSCSRRACGATGPWMAMVVAGLVIGIVVAFVPIVLGLPHLARVLRAHHVVPELDLSGATGRGGGRERPPPRPRRLRPAPRRGRRRGARSRSGDDRRHDRLLRVQPVLRLVEDHRVAASTAPLR